MKKTFLNYIDILLFIIIIYMKLFCYSNTLGAIFSTNLGLSFICSISMLVIISLFFNEKSRVKTLYYFNIAISIFIIANINYFRYFKDIISIPVLINGLMLGTVSSSVTTLFHFTDLFFLIDLAIFNPFSMHIFTIHFKKVALRLPCKNAVLTLIFIFCIFFQYFSFMSLAKEQPKLLSTMYNKTYIVKKIGFLNYCYVDAFNYTKNFITNKTPVTENKKSQIKTFLQNNTIESKDYKGIAKGKNLIILQVESLQGFVINSKINNEEITPNLNRFINRSLYFDNCFYQTASGGTSDAEFMMNTSLYPASSGAAYFLYPRNKFEALSSQLKTSGYSTAAFHGFKDTFWNRNIMYKQLQFDQFYSENSFDLSDTVGLGLSDKSFLNQSMEKLKTMHKPYFSFLITLSSHFPFDDINGFGNLDVSGFENTILGNYLKSINYTDQALGSFLDELDKEGTLKNSMVVIYGDHNALPKSQQKELANFFDKDSLNDVQWIKQQKIPLIIHFPDEKLKGINNTFSGQIDIYPTLANLYGIDHVAAMGKDLLNISQNQVIFRDGSFIDGKYYYNAATTTYYQLDNENLVVENNTLKNQKENAIKELEYSDDILKHNLIKKFQ